MEEMDYEGIVLKPLYAPYAFGAPKEEKKSRMAWVKWKRDYGQSWEADCVIVGARYGRGGRQVGLRSYTCALLLNNGSSASGRVLVTFTRVHSGLTVRLRPLCAGMHARTQMGVDLQSHACAAARGEWELAGLDLRGGESGQPRRTRSGGR